MVFIMTAERAIKILERRTTILGDETSWDDINNAIDMAIAAIHAQQGCEGTVYSAPNDPLTLEELRKMDGEPVWLRGSGLNRWYIFDGFSLDGVPFFTPEVGYGKLYAAYRRKPGEENDNV